MASFDTVNYSLRPSKSIQRQLIFNRIAKIRPHLNLEDIVYVGFGSVWFTDFVLAHKILDINDMISLEMDDIGYSRAVFNAPYATVQVRHGSSSEILPQLYDDERIRNRPWLVWLDYDDGFNESVKDDVASIVENAPTDSVLLVTFNGHEMKYGDAQHRPDRLRALFGDAVPDDLPKGACKKERMQETLADFALAFMQSTANDLARPGRFVPAFRLIYRDNAPMVTVGGLFPARGAARTAAGLVADPGWDCRPSTPIIAPHLTLREAVALQSKLPCRERLGRDTVRNLGFDIDDFQLQTFQTYYRHYPSFAQVIA